MSRAGLLLALFLAATAAAACQARPVEISLDSKIAYQTSRGWEVTAEIGDFDPRLKAALPYYQGPLADLAVDRIGINRMRLEVRSGAESTERLWEKLASGAITEPQYSARQYATVNDNPDPNVIDPKGFDFGELDHRIETAVLPLRERLTRRGEHLFVNLCYVAFADKIPPGARYDHRDPDEYAEFVLATYLHMRDRWGFVPDSWEVILEPDNTSGWNGVVLGEKVVKAAARLRAHGFDPHFVAPSTTDMGNAARYIDEIASVPGAMQVIDEFSYHRYRGVSVRALQRVASRAARYGKGAAMLEWWFGNALPDILHQDLTTGRNVAWQGQVLMDLADIDVTDPRHPRFTLRKDARLDSQYFRYIRFGARRIGARATTPRRVAPVAYVNPDGAYAVVLKTEAALPAVIVGGLPPGRYRVSWATDARSEEPGKTIEVGPAGTLTAAIPAAGVLSVFDARLAR